MTAYNVKKYADHFDVFGQEVPEIKTPTHKVKDWFYAKEVSKDVPSLKWTHILAVVKETEKAKQIIVKGCTADGDDAGVLLWCPKSCIEEIPVEEEVVETVNVYGTEYIIKKNKDGKLAAFTEDGTEHILVHKYESFSYAEQIADYLEC